jgi:hypothetical protein
MSFLAKGFEIESYRVYPYTNEQSYHFENKLAENKKTILIESDSYGWACAPFLSLSVTNLYFGSNMQNIISNINSYNPNIVIILLHTLHIGALQGLAYAFKKN